MASGFPKLPGFVPTQDIEVDFEYLFIYYLESTLPKS
jgi:hypothetical protein